MSRDTHEFVGLLSRRIPEVDALRVDHEESFGELLPHLLFWDVTKWAEEVAATEPDSPSLRTLITLIADAWQDDDNDEVDNLIAVSFAENIEDHSALLDLLSPELLALTEQMGIRK